MKWLRNACGAAVSVNERLTVLVPAFEGCRFLRNEHLHPYLYGHFLSCHDERHIKHLHN
jgi:hypothetical protein